MAFRQSVSHVHTRFENMYTRRELCLPFVISRNANVMTTPTDCPVHPSSLSPSPDRWVFRWIMRWGRTDLAGKLSSIAATTRRFM